MTLRDSLAQVQELIATATSPYHAEHARTSCSDDDPCNAEAEGSCGCARCTSIHLIRGEAAVAFLLTHGPELMKMLDRHGAGDAEEGSLRFIAKRNLRRMIEIGSTDTKTMLLCLEELS